MKYRSITALLILSASMALSEVGVFAAEPRAPGNTSVISAEKMDEQAEIALHTASNEQTTLPTAELLKKYSPLKSNKGSLSIKLTKGASNTKRENVEFSVSLVANVIDGRYVPISAASKVKANLNELHNSKELEEAAEEYAKCFSAAKADYHIQTDAQGMASIEGLPVGVYLVMAKDSDAYDTISPTLVALPSFHVIWREMVYELNIEPKHVPKKSPVIHKETSAERLKEEERPLHHTGYASYETEYLLGAGGLMALQHILRRCRKDGRKQMRTKD